ncbi:MAG: hypothetical protein ACRDBQ_18330 [Shewanella sp.]
MTDRLNAFVKEEFGFTRVELMDRIYDCINISVANAIQSSDDDGIVAGFPLDIFRSSPNALARFIEIVPKTELPKVLSFVLYAKNRLRSTFGVTTLQMLEEEHLAFNNTEIADIENRTSLYQHAYPAEQGPWPSDRYNLITLYLFIEAVKQAHFSAAV